MKGKEGVNLPEWLREELPPVQPPAVVGFANGRYTVTPPVEVGAYQTFKDLEEAYSYAESFGVGTRADETFLAVHPETFVTVKSKTSENFRLILLHNDKDKLALLEGYYEEFLRVATAWVKKKEDFMASYTFVHKHPAFWTRNNEEKTFEWNTSVDHFWMMPHSEVPGVHGWMLEAGAHIAPRYTSRYHDLRLDVYGKSVEECYIKLAALVDKFFELDGTEKEGVVYEKSELELRLDEALEDLQKQGRRPAEGA